MSYLTVVRTKTIDRDDDRACIASIETVTAGAYCPAAENTFCPSRKPTAMEARSNVADPLSADDTLELEMMADDANQETTAAAWRPLTQAENETMTLAKRIAHSNNNPATAWIRASAVKASKRAERAERASKSRSKDGKQLDGWNSGIAILVQERSAQYADAMAGR